MKFNRASLVTFLNLHYLFVAILALANLVMLTRLVLAWNTLRTDRPEQIAEYQANLKVMDLQMQPLRGLPAKVQQSSGQAAAFYGHRMPGNYSSISSELDSLATKVGVRKTRTQYTQLSAIDNLAEVRMDLSISGEYAPIMRYINGLERDPMFFIITGITLTGQQGGTVNLRLRLTTYIHAADVDRMAPPPNEGPANPETGTSPTATVGNAPLTAPTYAGGQ